MQMAMPDSSPNASQWRVSRVGRQSSSGLPACIDEDHVAGATATLFTIALELSHWQQLSHFAGILPPSLPPSALPFNRVTSSLDTVRSCFTIGGTIVYSAPASLHLGRVVHSVNVSQCKHVWPLREMPPSATDATAEIDHH